MVMLALGFAALAPVSAKAADTVNVRTLLPQMWDLRYLSRPPRPAFSAAQASSYDRASDPGPNSNPFANGDAGQFIRQDTIEGRKEDVMADLKGPGAIVRIWSANPHGTIRFYFDGETKPRMVAPMEGFMLGKGVPFSEPFSYGAAQGSDVYFPIPYAKSLRVTVESSRGLYYHVNYRSYAPGTHVETFQLSDLKKYAKDISATASRLVNLKPYTPKGTATMGHGPVVINGGQRELALSLGSGGTLTELSLTAPESTARPIRPWDWSDVHARHNLMRTLILEVECDGKTTILAPVGDFFSTAPGINPVHTLAFEVRADGNMTCKLPMPFLKGIKVWLHNTSPAALSTRLEAKVETKAPPKDAYHLNVQWTSDYTPTRPTRDLDFLNVSGEGYWIGSNLHVANPTPAWWGEGDEKVYVDGESFPSTFGTGTEDYYGYAWCSTMLFQRPYHAQNRCDGPANFGQTNVNRWQLFDPIPYTKSLRFDMEAWHWEDVKTAYSRTAYWYAKPGGTRPHRIDTSLLMPPETSLPKVAGAIEGESLVVIEKRGGKVQTQKGFFELSDGKQLWWTGNQDGNRLVLQIPVATAGSYEVVGNFCHANDYGIHKIKLNGQEIAPIDFYSPDVKWKQVSLGTFNLPAGTVLLEVECLGKNPKALEARMFGLDYLLLNRRS